MTWPSLEADKIVLNDRETARTVTGDRWPKREAFGRRSTDRDVDVNDQTAMVQSVPAVIKVWESAKIAQESWPIWTCSKWPINCQDGKFSINIQSKLRGDCTVPFLTRSHKNGRFHLRTPTPYTYHRLGGCWVEMLLHKEGGLVSPRKIGKPLVLEYLEAEAMLKEDRGRHVRHSLT